MMINTHKKWIPPLDYVFVETEFYEQYNFFQYCTCVYYVVNVMVGNEIGPRGEYQLLFLSILLMLSAFINANIFGHIIILLQKINKRADKFQEKLDSASQMMKNLGIPNEAQSRVNSYLVYTRSTLDHQKDLDAFLTLLSPSLKMEIRYIIFKEAILKNKVFEQKQEIIDAIVQDLTILRFMPEDPICKQGATGTNFYFISTGTCKSTPN
jgi:hypothetical protein